MYYIIAFLSVDVMTFREIRPLATNKKTPSGVITLLCFGTRLLKISIALQMTNIK